jgi:hypothetical protein
LIGCSEKPYINSPGDNSYNLDSIPVTVPDTNGIEISVDSAIAICKTLASGAVTSEVYKLTGAVTQNMTSPSDVPGKYSNINFKLSDNNGKTSITCYYINNINNRKFHSSSEVPLVGSKLAVLGALTNYNGTPELKDGFIVRIDSMVVPLPADTFEVTCEKAKEIALGLPSGGESKDVYIVEGYVQAEGYSDEISKGQQKWFWLDDDIDGGKVLEAYWCNVPDGEAVPVGAKVRLTGKLMNYNGTTAEIKNGDVEIIE